MHVPTKRNEALVMELARCEYIQRRENVIAVGNSGTGKTHIALEVWPETLAWFREYANQTYCSLIRHGDVSNTCQEPSCYIDNRH